MEEVSVDLIVIGSGPAGQKGAIQAAKLGKKVLVVEKGKHVGGGALNSGTIPSKSLREAILDLTDFYGNNFYGQKAILQKKISINDLNFRLGKVLEEQRVVIRRQFDKNHITLIHGSAHFETEQQLLIKDIEGRTTHRVFASKTLIATGSRPRNPNHVPFDEERILDSNRLLSIDHLPETLIVLGGGIIGAEYASFFAALGTRVLLIDKKERILPFLDLEMSLHLQTELQGLGLEFLGNKIVESITKKGDSVIVTCSGGSQYTAEMLLYALGREAEVKDLSIEKAGIQLDAQGYIPVSGVFQTVNPNLYAAGDVIGPPALASTSMEQGRRAACHAFGAETHPFPNFFPTGIYTIPEISYCGSTEEELKKAGFRYEVGRAHYYEIARNQITGNDPGMFKILFHADTLEILGVHIMGREATELIHIGQVGMSFHAKIDYFIDQVFNYPTFAEGYRIAALNGYNKIKRLNCLS